MADEITVGPWTISAERGDDGALSVEVRLDGEMQASLVLPPAGGAGDAGAPREDMDF